MFRNGLNPRTGVGMAGAAFRDALGRQENPDKMAYGMVLEARGNAAQRARSGAVARRRAANRRARTARKAARR